MRADGVVGPRAASAGPARGAAGRARDCAVSFLHRIEHVVASGVASHYCLLRVYSLTRICPTVVYLSRRIYMPRTSGALADIERLFKALADTTRLRIMNLLLAGEV